MLCCGCPLKAKAAREHDEQLRRNWEHASELQLWATRTHGTPVLLLLLQLRRLPALPPPSLDFLSVGAEQFDKPNEIIEKSSPIRASCNRKGRITTAHLTRAHFLPLDLQPAMLAGSPTSFPSFICSSPPAPGLGAALQHPAAATWPFRASWKAGHPSSQQAQSWAPSPPYPAPARRELLRHSHPTASIAMMLSSYTQRLAVMKPAQISVVFFNKNINPWSIHQGSEICC